ncbi:MAG: MerR family transcriptional regulator [Bacteroidales bacterium]|nr:MerR family transcriptional regulator [Bacteroidales bacterium]
MPYKKKNVEKVFYSIGEVSKIFNVNPSLLRFWEKEFNIIKPFKNKKGDRFYTAKDIEMIRYIYYLTKTKGLTLNGTKLYLKNKKLENIENEITIVEKLQNLKKELEDILKEINNITSDE